MKIPTEAIVPGGVWPTDHWHVVTNDWTCSRCREPIPDDEVPITLSGEREDGEAVMLIYCEVCLGHKARGLLQ